MYGEARSCNTGINHVRWFDSFGRTGQMTEKDLESFWEKVDLKELPIQEQPKDPMAIIRSELDRWRYLSELVDLPSKPVPDVKEEIPYVITLLWGIKTRQELLKAFLQHRCEECDKCKACKSKSSPCEDRDLLKSLAAAYGIKAVGLKKPLRSLR